MIAVTDIRERSRRSPMQRNPRRRQTAYRRSELAAATIGTNIFSHAYDSIGNHVLFSDNLTTNTFSHNQANQMVGRVVLNAPSTAFTYTPDGGLSSDGDWDYAYDAEDRLVSVTSSSFTNGAIRVFNSYDYRRRRISKTVQRLSVTTAPPPSPPVETYEWNTIEYRAFAYDNWNLIHETVATIDGGTTNVSEVQYFWGLDLSDTLQGAGGVEGLLAVSMDGVFYIPCYDHNGNIVHYVSETGGSAAQYVYDPYGNVVESYGDLADAFSFGFSTKYHDRETGMVGYQRRFYRPDLGRWLNRDPITEQGGENIYVFCLNKPIVVFDTDGRFALPIVITPDPETPQPYPIPNPLDQLGDDASPLGEEYWFQDNYAGWLEHSKSLFIDEINKGIDCKGDFNRKSSRQKVEVGNVGNWPWEITKGGNEKLYGDRGQSSWQAVAVLGNFSIDYVTPVKVTYEACVNRRRKFSWTTTMYVEDRLGLQGDEGWMTHFTWAAKSRIVKRAEWVIRGSGECACCD